MNQRQIDEYCAKVDDFAAAVSEIKRVLDADNEPGSPFFSRFLCEVCSNPPGLRIEMKGKLRTTKDVLYFAACLDCVYCIEHGGPGKKLLHRIK